MAVTAETVLDLQQGPRYEITAIIRRRDFDNSIYIEIGIKVQLEWNR